MLKKIFFISISLVLFYSVTFFLQDKSLLKKGKKGDLVSVVIPAYNHEKYVEDTLHSIKDQTYKNLEIIIVDDGSADLTLDKINTFFLTYKDRFVNVKVMTQENQGVTETLNRLIKHVSGSYVYLVASDDIVKPTAIEKLVNAINEKEEYVSAVGNNEYIDDKNQRICKEINNKLSCPTMIESGNVKKITQNFDLFGDYKLFLILNYVPNGMLVKSSVLKNVKFTKEAPLEDHYLHMQLSKYGKYKYVDEVLLSYRKHPTGTSNNREHMSNMSRKTLKYEMNVVHNMPIKKEYLSDIKWYLFLNKISQHTKQIEDAVTRIFNL